ncbi:hypothetical protein ZIOFF_024722 [Zingiber officinale]|uniref:Uncharacterized protein n=2 Tax=Zingiber officinale TaxID=94328 RepID=A0A8J5LDJ3_ZINOF|nr:hypothetical protein ZIOFF_024722 [Zingiber officinale]
MGRSTWASPIHAMKTVRIWMGLGLPQYAGDVAYVLDEGGGMKKELLASAPWRGEEDPSDKFADAKLRATNQPGGTPTMHVPGKRRAAASKTDEELEAEIDPELRYSFQRNFRFLQRVFSIDTIVKPLPPAMQYNVSRNLSFFTRIFTQFWDPEGIANAQRSLGLGQEEKARRVN